MTPAIIESANITAMTATHPHNIRTGRPPIRVYSENGSLTHSMTTNAMESAIRNITASSTHIICNSFLKDDPHERRSPISFLLPVIRDTVRVIQFTTAHNIRSRLMSIKILICLISIGPFIFLRCNLLTLVRFRSYLSWNSAVNLSKSTPLRTLINPIGPSFDMR